MAFLRQQFAPVENLTNSEQFESDEESVEIFVQDSDSDDQVVNFSQNDQADSGQITEASLEHMDDFSSVEGSVNDSFGDHLGELEIKDDATSHNA